MPDGKGAPECRYQVAETPTGPQAHAHTAARARELHDAGARALYQESLALFREQGHKAGIIRSLERLAAVAATHAQPARAAQLFGAAEGLRELLSAPLPPADRVAHDRAVAAVRNALVSEAFAAVWEAGRAMSLDEAIAGALAGPSPGDAE